MTNWALPNVYKLFDELGANVPKVRKAEAKDTYLKMMQANKENLLVSAHDISNGGMAVALSECLIGTDFGADISLDGLGSLPLNAKLFSESHSRFVVSVAPENREKFEEIMQDKAIFLGKVTGDKRLKL